MDASLALLESEARIGVRTASRANFERQLIFRDQHEMQIKPYTLAFFPCSLQDVRIRRSIFLRSAAGHSLSETQQLLNMEHAKSQALKQYYVAVGMAEFKLVSV
jgi:hypothetical protein